jgi:plasmid rolling circle replication initiator protein Rep|tara:strand:+ start:1485 stop:1727 length:243 start_codon:yes stop_codon:yes gene_type:complete
MKITKYKGKAKIEISRTAYYDRHGEKKFRLVKAGEILKVVGYSKESRSYLCNRKLKYDEQHHGLRQDIVEKIEIPTCCIV